jgi:glutathione S-transferase
MKLYYFETPNPRRPCAVAKYLNLPVDFVRIDLAKGEQKRPDLLAVNPNGKVPALEDGDVKLWESHAIMAYLSQKAGADLWPSDPREQVEIMKWLNWDTAHFSRHAARLYFERYLKGRLAPGEPDLAEIEEATGFFKRFAGVLNDHLAGRRFIVAERLTIADFGLAAFLPHAEEAGLPLEDCGNLRRLYDAMTEIEAWREPWPKQAAAVA